jgi:1-acyl-sn-glycerol-3-phosphate acyltransferase
MSGIRKISRLLLLFTVNLVFIIYGILINEAFFLESEKRMALRTHGMRSWARSVCLILGIHITPTGHYLEQGVFFIVSNHCSYLDILVVGALMPSVFVSKSEVASWAFLGMLVKLAGTVFVMRESKTASVRAMEAIREHLTNGISVVVFPEGTTNNGLAVRDFKSTFFKAPIDSGVPVLPLSIVYSHINGTPVTYNTIDTVAWHSDMELLPHVWNLMGVRRIDVLIHFNVPVYDLTGDRKKLSLQVLRKVKAGLDERAVPADLQ